MPKARRRRHLHGNIHPKPKSICLLCLRALLLTLSLLDRRRVGPLNLLPLPSLPKAIPCLLKRPTCKSQCNPLVHRLRTRIAGRRYNPYPPSAHCLLSRPTLCKASLTTTFVARPSLVRRTRAFIRHLPCLSVMHLN
jgi:hypothetical protein